MSGGPEGPMDRTSRGFCHGSGCLCPVCALTAAQPAILPRPRGSVADYRKLLPDAGYLCCFCGAPLFSADEPHPCAPRSMEGS